MEEGEDSRLECMHENCVNQLAGYLEEWNSLPPACRLNFSNISSELPLLADVVALTNSIIESYGAAPVQPVILGYGDDALSAEASVLIPDTIMDVEDSPVLLPELPVPPKIVRRSKPTNDEINYATGAPRLRRVVKGIVKDGQVAGPSRKSPVTPKKGKKRVSAITEFGPMFKENHPSAYNENYLKELRRRIAEVREKNFENY